MDAGKKERRELEKRLRRKHAGRHTRRSAAAGKLWILLIVLIAGVMVYAGANLLITLKEYRDGVVSYDSLQAYAIPSDTQTDTAADEEEEETDDFILLTVDFDALKEINEDLVCWIYVPAFDLSYPVVQGEDNEEYLYTTFEYTSNSSGCLFIDATNAADFTDRNTFIYGHNMKNGSMFGTLKRFYQDESYAAEDPYFYLYFGDRAVRYRIISYYVTESGSTGYSKLNSDEEYDTYLNWILRQSAYSGYEEALTRDRPDIVTLSTCYGASGGTGRFLVHGVVEEVRTLSQADA